MAVIVMPTTLGSPPRDVIGRGVDPHPPPTGGDGATLRPMPERAAGAYPVSVSAGTTPTLASLAQARARQRVVLQVLRPLAIGTVVLVSVIGSRSEPRVGVVLALIGF